MKYRDQNPTAKATSLRGSQQGNVETLLRLCATPSTSQGRIKGKIRAAEDTRRSAIAASHPRFAPAAHHNTHHNNMLCYARCRLHRASDWPGKLFPVSVTPLICRQGTTPVFAELELVLADVAHVLQPIPGKVHSRWLQRYWILSILKHNGSDSTSRPVRNLPLPLHLAMSPREEGKPAGLGCSSLVSTTREASTCKPRRKTHGFHFLAARPVWFGVGFGTLCRRFGST
jgi:hypothetical protein